MSQQHPIMQLLENDNRYSLDAYQFVCDALSYAQQVLGYGEERTTEVADEPSNPFMEGEEEDDPDAPRIERHITGQQLCEAIRQYAIDQYGYMAKVVLNSWGVHSTNDFGEIVFNLVRIGRLKKSENDRVEDFDNCFDFADAFERRFTIKAPKE